MRARSRKPDIDIEYLFDNVSVGTRVQLIDQPVKVTTEPDGSRWVEVHEPLSRNRAEFESTRKVPLPISAALRSQLVSEGAAAELERRSGMPVRLAMPGGVALSGPTGP